MALELAPELSISGSNTGPRYAPELGGPGTSPGLGATGTPPLTYDQEVLKRVAESKAGRAAGGPPSMSKAAPGMLDRMLSGIPTIQRGMGAAGGVLRTLGGVAGKFLPGVGTAAAIGGEGFGVADTAIDPFATKVDVATRAAEGVGRVGAMGAGAGLGALAGGPIGAVTGGALGYAAPNAIYAARDWWQGRGKPAASSEVVTPVPAATPVATGTPTVVAPGVTGASQAQVRKVDNSIMGDTTAKLYPNGAPVTAMGATDIRGRAVPATNTGAFVNNKTGAVTTIDSRSGSEFGPPTQADLDADAMHARGVSVYGHGANPTPGWANGLPDVAGAYVAQANLRMVGNQQAAQLQREHWQMQYGGKTAAEIAEINSKTQLNKSRADAAARMRASSDPDREMKAAAIESGRNLGGLDAPAYTVPVTAIPDPKTGAVPVLQTRGHGAGTIRTTTPEAPARAATKEQFAADVKTWGSKDAVLREYTRRNITPPKE